MTKGQNLKWIFGGLLLTLGSAMLAQSGWAQATPPAEDNVVKTSIYFPMPYVNYNTLYLGKKLDIGISNDKIFSVTLGSTECDGASMLVGTGNEMPSLWLPSVDPDGNEVTATPLLLRSRLPDNTTNIKGELALTGLAAPILVKELEVGARSFSGSKGGDLQLRFPETSMESVSIELPNLLLGNASASGASIPEFSNVEVTGSSADIKNLYMGSTSTLNRGAAIPNCPDSVHWEKVSFGGDTKIVLACGEARVEPFETDYECPTNSRKVWCNRNSSDNLFCDYGDAGCNAILYRWSKYLSYAWTLPAAQHETLCAGADATVTQAELSDAFSAGHTICPGTLDTSGNWNTSAPSGLAQSGNSCYKITKFAESISCSEEEKKKPVADAVTYDQWMTETFDFADCMDFCNSFNS